MWAILTDWGTATSETALCDNDFTEKNREIARNNIAHDDDDVHDLNFKYVYDNDYLECIICGDHVE